jgi:hypothetical protein
MKRLLVCNHPLTVARFQFSRHPNKGSRQVGDRLQGFSRQDHLSAINAIEGPLTDEKTYLIDMIRY